MDTIILADWLSARLDRTAAEPMYRQVLELMQQAILTGQLAPGTKLPSSRTLAIDLGIARNTVLHVYDQLTAEGYVTSTTGSGTYVADTAPRDGVARKANGRGNEGAVHDLASRRAADRAGGRVAETVGRVHARRAGCRGVSGAHLEPLAGASVEARESRSADVCAGRRLSAAAARAVGLFARRALGEMSAGPDHHHDGHSSVDRSRRAPAHRFRRSRVGRGTVLLGRAQRAAIVGPDARADSRRRGRAQSGRARHGRRRRASRS